MSWSLGWDCTHHRWFGYGVPAVCEHPECDEPIDRGISYMCGGGPGGNRENCGMFFCDCHLHYYYDDDGPMCERCGRGRPPFDLKPDTREWLTHLLTDDSWEEWRAENPRETKRAAEQLRKQEAA